MRIVYGLDVHKDSINLCVLRGQRIFPVGMMGKALTHIRHIE